MHFFRDANHNLVKICPLDSTFLSYIKKLYSYREFARRLDIRREVFPVGIRRSLSRVTEALSGAEEAIKLLSQKNR